MRPFISGLLIAIFLLGMAACKGNTDAQNLKVATAASFAPTMKRIAEKFEKESGISVAVVSGSSGKLVAQIEQGAPFHFFFSADEKYPNQIYQLSLGEKPRLYAMGQLAVWTKSIAKGEAWTDYLQRPECARIAIPNPELAPYGVAAYDLLELYQLLDTLRPKILPGESVSHVASMVGTGAVDAAILSASYRREISREVGGQFEVLKKEPMIPQAYNRLQKANLIPEIAAEFEAFLRTPQVEKIITGYGYVMP